MDFVAGFVAVMYVAFVLFAWLLARAADDFITKREQEIREEREGR